MKNKSICFVAPEAYPLLAKTKHHSVGGAEVQQVLIAKELKKYGFDVSFVVGSYATKLIENVDGIRIIKSSSRYSGGKLNYLLTLFALFIALRKANADVYFLRSPKHLLGVIGFYCRFKKRKFIFSSSIDYDSNLKHIRETESNISRILFFYGIKQADAVVAQSNHQRRQFEMNFGLNSILIKNMQPLTFSIPSKELPPVALWVGTAYERKRPHLFLELAKTIPFSRFRMVVAPGRGKKLNEAIEEHAKEISNLEYLGFIPYHKINEQYARASILINTSRWEGFPNTFLQAWANKTPAVSLEIDPDEVICKNKLGFHSSTFDKMVKDIKLLLKNENLRREMGENARKYVEREHDIKKVAQQYAELFQNLQGKRWT
ncbi:glycosyltransferase family 4 protein [candidate division WOR-3 bacterium]|nr:glycosyltransferase family 4 protein [candidate division WOR-3 bacterium]